MLQDFDCVFDHFVDTRHYKFKLSFLKIFILGNIVLIEAQH